MAKYLTLQGLTTFWTKLKADYIDKKVDKVEGKGLSTNDLTNELKSNYDSAYTHSQSAHAPSNAQANVIETVKVNGVAVDPVEKAVSITIPTKLSELEDDGDFGKTYTLSGNANAVNGTVEVSLSDGNSDTTSVKITGSGSVDVTSDESGNILISGSTDYYSQSEIDTKISALNTLIANAQAGKVILKKVTVLPETGDENTIYLIPKASGSGSNVCDEYLWIESKWELVGDTSADLSGYVTTTALESALAGKVDKVDGKGLSTNDLTNELKANYDSAYTHSQSAHAPSNAQANVIETVKVNGVSVNPVEKAVDITLDGLGVETASDEEILAIFNS